MEGRNLMPLSMADSNAEYTVSRIQGKDEVRSHLSHLGIIPNEKIRIKQRMGRNVVVEVKGVRIALDASLAGRIWVMA